MYWVKKLIGIGLFMLVSYSVLITNTGSSLTLSDSNRKALVIGNANYPKRGKFVPLPNPLNNAQAIAQRLREYGFAVTKVIDVNSIAMKDAIDKFTNSLNIDDVALVYFSGHGIVTACYRGEEQKNFLIPVQSVFNGKADICEDAVPAQWLINLLNERNGGTNILLLDTCRNLLLEDQGTSNSGEMVTMKSAGTFIGYASAPGRTSKGDEESAYSVFTEQFLEKLSDPHDALPLELLFKDVRTAVATKAEELGFEQVPWDDNGLVGENFCFRIPCKSLVAPADTEEKLQQERQEKERLEAENRQLKEQLAQQHKQVIQDKNTSHQSQQTQHRLSFEPEMVNIPAGCFQMGSPKSEEGRIDDESPQHRVCVEAFAMGKYEITNAQFRKFRSNHNSGEYEGHSLNDDNQPVVNITWDDAVAYTQWLSQQTGKNYRLPSEAEWEYAARAGTTTRYYWGDEIDSAKLNFSDKNDLSGPSRKDLDDGYAVSAPVGSYSPNPWGLYDMLGNVWEWNQDKWHNSYTGAPTDGSAWEAGGSNYLLRGGSWRNNPDICRSANRNDYDVSYSYNVSSDYSRGVRVAVVSP